MKIACGCLVLAGLALALALAMSGGRKTNPPPPTRTLTIQETKGPLAPMEFSLRTGSVKHLGHKRASISRYWGFEESRDCGESMECAALVQKMTPRIGGQSVLIPEQAYLDLVDLRFDSIIKEGQDYFLRMDGADTCQSYHLRMQIHAGRVVCRELANGEFPNPRFVRTFSYGGSRIGYKDSQVEVPDETDIDWKVVKTPRCNRFDDSAYGSGPPDLEGAPTRTCTLQEVRADGTSETRTMTTGPLDSTSDRRATVQDFQFETSVQSTQPSQRAVHP